VPLAIVLLIRAAWAQGSGDHTRFATVENWYGTITVKITGSGSNSTPVIPNGSETVSYSANDFATINIMETNPTVIPNFQALWQGDNQTSISIDERYHVNNTATSFTDDETWTGSQTKPVSISIGISFASNTYSLLCPCTLRLGPPITFDCDASVTHQQMLNPGGTTTTTEQRDWGGDFIQFSSLPLPVSGMVLSGSSNFSFNDTIALNPLQGTINWNLSPTPLDLDLILTLPNYETWRPTGGLTEKDTGLTVPVQNTVAVASSRRATPKSIAMNVGGGLNLLEIQAALVTKSTGQPAPIAPDSVTFSLVNASSEPGVALNWPQMGKATADPDLTFDPAQNPGFDISGNGTTATYTPVLPNVSAFVSPHDWGGWATVNVTATVNGQTLQGHMMNDPNTDILIPQRQPGSFIADSWKSQHNIPLSTPDSDDSESSPVGDGQPGDGLTLYEEYRGFYMGCAAPIASPPQPEGQGGCQHVEGDPATKDLFVVNTIGYPADLGVQAFAQASGLKVHSQGLMRAELSPDRVINFNHASGAHVVDQHGLVMVSVPPRNSSAAVGGPGLPRQIQQIEIPIWTVTGVIPSPFEEVQNGGVVTLVPSQKYLRMIAHELGHSVDVYHHGDNVDLRRVTWTANNGQITETIYDPNGNAVGRTITVTDQSGNPFVFGISGLPSTMSIYVANGTDGTTVMLNGQHSGDVACFMRYVSAGAYIPLGQPSMRILTTETPGLSLTDVLTGLPRYGDAAPGRGNCADQLDVNDAHQPH
jgi:hypothetical protein